MPISIIPGKKSSRNITKQVKDFLKSYKEYLPSIVVLAVAFTVHAGVIIWHNSVASDLQATKQEKTELLAQIQSQKVQDTQEFARTVRGLQEVISNQNKPSGFFGEFEASVHDDVLINDFQLNAGSALLSVSGSALNFEDVGQQLLIWKNRSDFVSGVKLGAFDESAEGLVDFSAEIKVKPEFIK